MSEEEDLLVAASAYDETDYDKGGEDAAHSLELAGAAFTPLL
jgi:hypothetical protein